jgi:hypothetical protein
MECEKVHPIDEDGWSDWISPKPRGYLMQCCDCGLIHEVDFDVVRYTGEPDENELSPCEVVEDKSYAATFRVRRHEVEQVEKK